ncbi:MAG TPA: phage portal protein [Roseiarcus sp.]|nr:phage portal protein [Roseiarcus sp.]
MPSGGVETPIPASVFARLTAASRFVISGIGPDSWFGPQQPLIPQAPPEVKGRQWDYPFGLNINYVPRSDNLLSFGELRTLANALPLLRSVIETRKDQIAALNWTVRPRLTGARPGAAQRGAAVRDFLAFPDRRHDFSTWLRMLVEDMLVIDAATLYPRYARSGAVYSLDVIDGSTIKPLIGEDGRSPVSPDPAYSQVLHGVPAADFTADELIYQPRNMRSHRLYGFSPVEQIALTINIALRREQATLDYYNTGSNPDSFTTLPKDWTVDQVRQFQDYFDALMSGNLARRRMVKFMPAEFKLTETRQPPLKDLYDEWLARLICYAFSVPASAFVTQVNRATSQTLRTQAAQEGLVPLKAWVKRTLDRVIGLSFGEPDLEFCWVGDDAIDPLEQAQTISILVGAGVKTVAEARAELGLGQGSGVVKYNHYHDERGQFTDADHAVESGGEPQVAENENSPTMSDAGSGRRAAAGQPSQLVAQDITQTCNAYIAANRQGRILREFPGQFLTSTLQEVIAAAKAGDPAAKKACKLLFNNRSGK